MRTLCFEQVWCQIFKAPEESETTRHGELSRVTDPDERDQTFGA
jgi:hypothetical protein